AILGPSGSGKSTLLNLLGGIDTADSGTILVNEMDYQGKNDMEMAEFRRKTIGFVFQSFNLIPVLSVYENIVMPSVIDNRQIDDVYVKELIAFLGIEDKYHSMPDQLSGGQQQRVAIARAMVNKPKVILADEPTGNLDSDSGELVMKLLLDGARKYRQTVIMITHNKELAEKADRKLYIQDGRVMDR
ncbi:MAG: ABC transporter ATP-binding protein, partial [Clostridium sp.]|nr:ABC transporter ATP-binding protein [Clostridium sp.]